MHTVLLQCHGAADEALASATTTLKSLLTLPAQAAQVAYYKMLLSTQIFASGRNLL